MNMAKVYFKFKNGTAMRPSSQSAKNTLWRKCVSWLEKRICANPDFEDKIPYVAQWYVEYDEDLNVSGREIGLDADN